MDDEFSLGFFYLLIGAMVGIIAWVSRGDLTALQAVGIILLWPLVVSKFLILAIVAGVQWLIS